MVHEAQDEGRTGKGSKSNCVLEFFVLYGDVWWLHEVFARDGLCRKTDSAGVQQAAIGEIEFIQSQFLENKYIPYNKESFVKDRHILGMVLHGMFGWYGYCVSLTLKTIDEYPRLYTCGTLGIGVTLLAWTIIGLIQSVPKPRDLGTFELVEHSPLLKIVLLACTHAIIVIFARAQQATLKRIAFKSRAGLLDDEKEHLQYPCLLPFIVGKFFLIARMALAYSNPNLGIAIDYFIIQETILITVHGLIAMIGVPVMEKCFQGESQIDFMKKMQARFWSVLIADSIKTGIMFIFFFYIFTPGPISRYFNRLPDQKTQIAVAVLIHGVLDAVQALVTFFMFYIGEFGRRLMGGRTNNSPANIDNELRRNLSADDLSNRPPCSTTQSTNEDVEAHTTPDLTTPDQDVSQQLLPHQYNPNQYSQFPGIGFFEFLATPEGMMRFDVCWQVRYSFTMPPMQFVPTTPGLQHTTSMQNLHPVSKTPTLQQAYTM